MSRPTAASRPRPSGGNQSDGRFCQPKYGFGPFIPILPYLEQSNVFNLFNFSNSSYSAPNYSFAGIGISTLWCPSDPLVADGDPIDLAFYTCRRQPAPDQPPAGDLELCGQRRDVAGPERPLRQQRRRPRSTPTSPSSRPRRPERSTPTRAPGSRRSPTARATRCSSASVPSGCRERSGHGANAASKTPGGTRATGAIRTSTPVTRPTPCGRTRPSSTRAGGGSSTRRPAASIPAA